MQLTFDGHINVPTLILVATILIGWVVAWVRMDDRVNTVTAWTEDHAKCHRRMNEVSMRLERAAATLEEMSRGMEKRIDRLEDK